VSSDEVTEDVLSAKLRSHVEAKHAELASLSLGGEAAGAAGDEEAAAAALAHAGDGKKLYIGGLDTDNMEFKYIYGHDFKITYWQ